MQPFFKSFHFFGNFVALTQWIMRQNYENVKKITKEVTVSSSESSWAHENHWMSRGSIHPLMSIFTLLPLWILTNYTSRVDGKVLKLPILTHVFYLTLSKLNLFLINQSCKKQIVKMFHQRVCKKDSCKYHLRISNTSSPRITCGE